MKIHNFQLLNTEYHDFGVIHHATIDITTGRLWWKKTRTLELFRSSTDNWRRADNGDYVTNPQVRHLARVWTARTGEPC